MYIVVKINDNKAKRKKKVAGLSLRIQIFGRKTWSAFAILKSASENCV